MNRVTTRGGRKIRHVAPGHVLDMSTGMDIVRHTYRGGWHRRKGTCFRVCWRDLRRSARGIYPPEWREFPSLDVALGEVAIAEALCTLVRGMLAIAATALAEDRH